MARVTTTSASYSYIVKLHYYALLKTNIFGSMGCSLPTTDLIIPTHCRPVRLICIRTVLLTDAYLVLFSFWAYCLILYTVFCVLFYFNCSLYAFVLQY